MSELFGPRLGDSHSVIVVPPFHHPDWGGKPHFSVSGEEVGTAYEQMFRGTDADVRVTSKPLRPNPSDGLVVIGSRFDNIEASRRLGHADAPLEGKGRFVIKHHASWQTQAEWVFHTPINVSRTAVKLPSFTHSSRDHMIVSRNFKIYKSNYRSVGDNVEREDDYLLITVLPRFDTSRPQRVVLLEGLHRSGTRIAANLFNTPPITELDKLRRKVHGPYYQAVFRSSVHLRGAELFPDTPRLVDARTLEI
jgi:hypothetical protein